MISKSQISLFVILVIIWASMRKFLFSTLAQTADKENIPSVAYNSPSKTEHLLQGIEKIENETESLNKAYKLLSFVIFHTKSSKSRIEYERAIGYFRNFIFENNPPAQILFEKTEKIQELKGNEICPEREYVTKDLSSQNYEPMWFDPLLKTNCKVPPLDSLVTLFFNFVNEIPLSKAEDLFLDAADCKYKNMHMLALVATGSSYKHLTDIATKKLPNMKIVESSKASHIGVLREAMNKVSTKYVVITRNIERFDNFSVVIRLVRDLSLGNAEVVGGTQRNISGHWKAGCYQVKMEADLLHFEEGYDESDNGCMYCDYLSVPFAVKTANLNQYLQQDFVSENELRGDFLYMEYFMMVRFKAKQNIFMCIDSMFYTETSALQVHNNNKNAWLPFLRKYKYSTITFGFPDQKHKLEYLCSDVALTCTPSTERVNQCCIREAESYIKDVVEILSKSNVSYQFKLRTMKSEPYWDTIGKMGISAAGKFIIPIQTNRGRDELKNVLKLDGFEWKDSQFSSASWLFHFLTVPSSTMDIKIGGGYTISFGRLHLPVVEFPGDSLFLSDTHSCKTCLDLLFNYRDMKSYKIWL